MAVTADVQLLEREAELAALDDALTAVSAARAGRLAIVTGEAGSGKSELLRRFCESQRAFVLWAGCDALFTPRPLGPFLDIAETLGGALREQVAAGAMPHDVTRALLRELDGPAPAIVVLEDLHAADDATLDVVRLLARRLDALKALLVASFRDDQLGRTHPLRAVLADLPRDERVIRVPLQPLSPGGVATLAEPARVDPDELYARTGGNPFFVTEVLAAQADRIPETVRDAVLARAARLAPATRALLDAVSIVPQPTEIWLLEGLAPKTGSALEECLASGILVADRDTVRFRHELSRLAVEESLPPDQRVALHRVALAALADPPQGRAEPARLAHHAEAAGDRDGVLRHARAAAEEAGAAHAHREAAAQYARVLRFAGALPDRDRAALLEEYGAACYLTDMRSAGIDALAEAAGVYAGLADDVGAARALMAQAGPLSCAGRAREARAVTERAAAILRAQGDDAAVAHALSELSAVAMCADDHDTAIESGTQAIAAAERLGETRTLIRALNSTGVSVALRGDEAGVAMIERSMALARSAGDDPGVGRGYINWVAVLGRRRAWSRAAPVIEEGLAFCRERGLEAWESCLLGARATVELALGRYDAAATTAADALERAWAEHATARLEPLIVLGLVRARRGDPDVWTVLDEARDIAVADGSLQLLAPVAAARAEAAWLAGRPEDVAAETGEALGLARSLGDAMTVDELLGWRRRAGAGDEAPAAAAWEGMPYESALALADTGDESALRAAHERLRELGAAPAAAIVARRLRARGARNLRRGPHARSRENPAGLTRRELEVLALLAEGLRNADIAARLVLSEKTVDHHVSAILRKLGVKSRAQAAVAALRDGLVELGKT